MCDGARHDHSATSRRTLLKQVLAASAAALVRPASFALGAGRGKAGVPRSDMRDAARASEAAARAFLASLGADQRALAAIPYADDRREEWYYIPKVRRGVTYKQLDPAQRKLAEALLATGAGARGIQKIETIRSLDLVLQEIEHGTGPVRDPELYYVTVFGEPGRSAPWGWSFEGHHVSLNFALADDGRVATTPSFLGANPAEVRHGPRTGLRTLPVEEDAGRALVRSLDDAQRKAAVLEVAAPSDILSTNVRKVERPESAGVTAKALGGKQTEMLMRIFEEFAGTVSTPLAAARMRAVRAAGLENIRFAWAGGLEPGKPHYYRIQAPAFLLEYDNTQNDANHIHTVWRDFDGDFGTDLLAEHYDDAHR